MHKRMWLLLIWVAIIAAPIATFADETGRLQNAAEVIRALRAAPDKGIPEELWNDADCVAVIPQMKKGAFIVGGEYGRGAMSCRNAGGWTSPLFLQLAKGSWGLQIGAEEVDLVLLVMNREGVDRMLDNKINLGADASVAAGPVGRTATASTDGRVSAKILSYSRARGAFAGINLSGGVLRPDTDANKQYYGGLAPHDVLAGKAVTKDAAAMAFVNTLGRDVRATTGRR
jgi:lipid-binding SYLF domain-containing protein